MGLQDRDYMRERDRKTFDRMMGDDANPFTPAKEGSSLLTMLLWWAAIGYGLYLAYGWWEQRQRNERLAHQAAAATGRQAQRSLEAASARGNPREQGMPAAASTIARLPEEPAGQIVAPTTGGTIYLCRAYDGGIFWAQAHCSQHRALIDRIANVPAGLPFDQQVQIAQEQRQAAERLVYVAPTPSPEPDLAVVNHSQCKSLDARVQQLDNMARQPQSAQTQDWIRERRKEARDRQFGLRC